MSSRDARAASTGCQRVPGAIVHASVADPRRPVLAELPARGDVGQPAEVAADADAGQVDRAERAQVDRRVRWSVEPRRSARRRAARRTAAAASSPVGRPEPRRVDRPRRAGRGRWPPPRPRRRRPGQRGQRRSAIADPAEQPPAPHARPALEPPGDPEAAEQARREQRQQPRIGRLERRQERPRPERQQLGRRRRRSTGPGTAGRAIPSQTIAGKATSPRATGGQIDAGERRSRSGSCAVSPTMRSSGPPGR